MSDQYIYPVETAFNVHKPGFDEPNTNPPLKMGVDGTFGSAILNVINAPVTINVVVGADQSPEDGSLPNLREEDVREAVRMVAKIDPDPIQFYSSKNIKLVDGKVRQLDGTLADHQISVTVPKLSYQATLDMLNYLAQRPVAETPEDHEKLAQRKRANEIPEYLMHLITRSINTRYERDGLPTHIAGTYRGKFPTEINSGGRKTIEILNTELPKIYPRTPRSPQADKERF